MQEVEDVHCVLQCIFHGELLDAPGIVDCAARTPGSQGEEGKAVGGVHEGDQMPLKVTFSRRLGGPRLVRVRADADGRQVQAGLLKRQRVVARGGRQLVEEDGVGLCRY